MTSQNLSSAAVMIGALSFNACNSGMINRFMISLKPNRIGNLVSVSDCVIHSSDFLCDDWPQEEKT